MLRKVIAKHTTAILNVFQRQLQGGAKRTVFSAPGAVTLVVNGMCGFLSVDDCSTRYLGRKHARSSRTLVC